MNADKISGKGTLKVCYKVTDPQRRLISEKRSKQTFKTTQTTKGSKTATGPQALKQGRPEKFMDGVDNGPKIVKSGRPTSNQNTQ